ncbi:B-box zinc finger 20 [Olea europaea subsp. europaea]|uniref:B-box zinc finger 20 n=1 Tax=Olea europaea subsp. europaea TaxID=158383 RepID=A0A8S0UHP1_OLEEU|nr:B-box zinc finger 20 [Olea europaea subsp. europaea]
MKIQCDVCGKEEAYIFCTADEAALCQACDCRVHRANKLASKHPRFSLLHPSSIDSPRCDICRERRALLFCQEDRALLCRECDIPIHKANEYTKNHNRFLLTGIKLSAFAASYQASTSFSITGSNNANKNFQTDSDVNTSESTSTTLRRVHNNGSDRSGSQEGSVSMSGISEYLIETLPGWHVEELLDPFSSHVFCKINDQIISPSTNDDDVESDFDPIFI